MIALAHDPDVFPFVPDARRAHVSGHTHGGQVAIPLRAPRRSCPRATASASPAATSSSTAATSWSAPGSGTSGLPIRLLAPPELLVLELHPEER